MNKGNKKNILTAEDLLNADLDDVNWLIDNLLPAGLTFLVGRPKSGKSFMGLDLAVSIASGEKFLDRFNTNKATTLFISNEDSLTRLQSRLKQIVPIKEIKDVSDLDNLMLKVDFPKLNEYGLEKLKGLVKEHGIKLVFVESKSHIPKDTVITIKRNMS